MSKFMYIGPSRPFGLPLVHNQILGDELLVVYPQAASAVAEHPELARLTVEIGPNLARARAGLKRPGSLFGKAFASLKGKMQAPADE